MRDPKQTTPGGWVISVLLTPAGEPQPLVHYFAVGYPDQGKAEWSAMDAALPLGEVSASPVAGQEPVRAERQIMEARMEALGLKAREVRALGWRRPRRWLDG
jgi:hypothetical protein